MHSIDVSTLSSMSYSEKEKFICDRVSDKKVNIEVSYLSDFHNARILRDVVAIVWNCLWLTPVIISRMTLIADEMNNNAIEHGSMPRDTNSFRLSCEPRDGGIFVRMEVQDSGKWWDAKKALDMETLRAHQLKLWYRSHSSIRGRGLFMIIVNLVDRVYFKDALGGGLIVWVKKHYNVKGGE